MKTLLGLLSVRIPKNVFDSSTDMSLVTGHECVAEFKFLREAFIEKLVVSSTKID